MRTFKDRLVHVFIIGIFASLYFLVATISMINSVEFFDLAHGRTMSWSLAIGFELGAAASLAAIVILHKTNRAMVWFLFLLLTAFQMMANSYHAFANLEGYMGWIELFGLENEEPLFQKRLLSIVSGAILPIVALGFIKSLVDYIRPDIENEIKDKPTFTEEYFDTRNDMVKRKTMENDPSIKKAQYDQIERIKKQMQPLPKQESIPSEDKPLPPEAILKHTEPEKEKKKINKNFEINDHGDDDFATPPKLEPEIKPLPDDIDVEIKGDTTYVRTKPIDPTKKGISGIRTD